MKKWCKYEESSANLVWLQERMELPTELGNSVPTISATTFLEMVSFSFLASMCRCIVTFQPIRSYRYTIDT